MKVKLLKHKIKIISKMPRHLLLYFLNIIKIMKIFLQIVIKLLISSSNVIFHADNEIICFSYYERWLLYDHFIMINSIDPIRLACPALLNDYLTLIAQLSE